MKERDHIIAQLRGESLGSILPHIQPDELFQNTTLRPILKFQNDLFLAAFRMQVAKYRSDFKNLKASDKADFIDKVVKKDLSFKTEVSSFVVALFTSAEFEYYARNTADINKRINNMVAERIKSQLLLLED